MTDSISFMQSVEAMELSHLEAMRRMMFYLYNNRKSELTKNTVAMSLENISAVPRSIAFGLLNSLKDEGLITINTNGRIQIKLEAYQKMDWTTRRKNISTAFRKTESRVAKRQVKMNDKKFAFIRYRVFMPFSSTKHIYPVYIAITYRGKFIGDTILNFTYSEIQEILNNPSIMRDAIIGSNNKTTRATIQRVISTRNLTNIKKACEKLINDPKDSTRLVITTWKVHKIQTRDQIFDKVIDKTKNTYYDIYSSDNLVFDRRAAFSEGPQVRVSKKTYRAV